MYGTLDGFTYKDKLRQNTGYKHVRESSQEYEDKGLTKNIQSKSAAGFYTGKRPATGKVISNDSMLKRKVSGNEKLPTLTKS
jgi:hypothetical protein